MLRCLEYKPSSKHYGMSPQLLSHDHMFLYTLHIGFPPLEWTFEKWLPNWPGVVTKTVVKCLPWLLFFTTYTRDLQVSYLTAVIWRLFTTYWSIDPTTCLIILSFNINQTSLKINESLLSWHFEYFSDKTYIL